MIDVARLVDLERIVEDCDVAAKHDGFTVNFRLAIYNLGLAALKAAVFVAKNEHLEKRHE